MSQSLSLAEDLAFAQARLLQTRQDLQQLETALYATLLPIYYWPVSVQRSLRFVEARFSRAQRDCYRLQNTVAKPEPVAPAPDQPPPATPERAKRGRRYHQSAEVHLIDGQAVTKIVDFQNDYWLNLPDVSEADTFCRQIAFAGNTIPEHYAEILRRHDITLNPKPRGLFLSYEPDAFLDLCRQELESGAQHFTEGNPFHVRALV